MNHMLAKLISLPLSRRFIAAVIGVVVVVLQDVVGLTEDQAQMVAGLIMAWIIGDSITPTGVGRITK